MSRNENVFYMETRHGYKALVTKSIINGEVVYELEFQNDLYRHLQNLRLVKRSGVWYKHGLNTQDPEYTKWGNMIEEFLSNLL